MTPEVLFRKVRRLFGDEFDIVITQQDIIDWANTAQSDIVRETQCLPKTINVPANQFPITIPDFYLMSRVGYGSPLQPKGFVSLEELDLEGSSYNGMVASPGIPNRYYLSGNMVYLYPTPLTTDVSTVSVTYVRAPQELNLLDPWFNYRGATGKYVRTTSAISGDLANAVDNWLYIFDVQPSSWASTVAWYIGSIWGTADANKVFRFHKTNLGILHLGLWNGSAETAFDAPTALPAFAAGARVKLAWAWNRATNAALYWYSTDNGASYASLGQSINAFTDLVIPTVETIELGSFGAGNATDLFRGRHYGVKVYQDGAPFTSPFQGFLKLEINPEKDFEQLNGNTGALSLTATTGQTVQWDAGMQLFTDTNELDVPVTYHEDVVRFCLARAYEKNENYQAQEQADNAFQQGVSQRRYEALLGDEGFPSIRPDPLDWW
jgi:hypothetical protein